MVLISSSLKTLARRSSPFHIPFTSCISTKSKRFFIFSLFFIAGIFLVLFFSRFGQLRYIGLFNSVVVKFVFFKGAVLLISIGYS